ncbi:MAG: 4Fe-4S binding protein [candidate division KSB1 bacterium]|nr:4Fe-4S binding protein [candidate division KSB1 bacterium]
MQKGTPVIEINKSWCKGCAICVEFCPRKVLAMKGAYPEVVDLEACTACQLCEVLCPDFAITVRRTKQNEDQGE